ncbi:MAG TPA: hypothetical protein VMR02_21290 [Terracidiphilus sp.]|jgi:hypothetical protein|nr:hypothetical protein [Terracidiphilus sp.]
MKSEWHKFNPKDRITHPKDNSRVQIKCADGTQISGGYLKGYFLHGSVISATAVNQTKYWRYAE